MIVINQPVWSLYFTTRLSLQHCSLTYVWCSRSLLTSGKHLHGHIISLRVEIWANKTSLSLSPKKNKKIKMVFLLFCFGDDNQDFINVTHLLLSCHNITHYTVI